MKHLRTSVLTALALLAGCASRPATTADAASFEARGVHVRHVRLRLAPAHTKAFEELMTHCATAAQAASLPEACEWLCYYEAPGRYWVLWFGETRDGFAIPDDSDPLASLVLHVAGFEGDAARAEAGRRLATLDYEIEWNTVHRQKEAWSTVEGMSSDAHPKARMMVRTVVPGAEVAFDQALTARTAFLLEHGYPLPIEGFVTLEGAPGTALQVVFPVDWPTFHATDSFGAFVRGLDEAAQADYARRKAMLMHTMSRAEYYDGSYESELSYSADD